MYCTVGFNWQAFWFWFLAAVCIIQGYKTWFEIGREWLNKRRK